MLRRQRCDVWLSYCLRPLRWRGANNTSEIPAQTPPIALLPESDSAISQSRVATAPFFRVIPTPVRKGFASSGGSSRAAPPKPGA